MFFSFSVYKEFKLRAQYEKRPYVGGNSFPKSEQVKRALNEYTYKYLNNCSISYLIALNWALRTKHNYYLAHLYRESAHFISHTQQKYGVNNVYFDHIHYLILFNFPCWNAFLWLYIEEPLIWHFRMFSHFSPFIASEFPP